ncbi:MAG: glycogen synthase, partial [bacterium]|nr:glycogen synthase [bacterium]
MSRILMVASEAFPLAKSGGLADVVGALPPALAAHGDEVAVLMPRYGTVPLSGAEPVNEGLTLWLGPVAHTVDIYMVTQRGVPFFLLDCPPLYDRDGLYVSDGADHPDNHVRFAVLCRAALEVVRRIYRPQVLHCHDWQASLVGPYLKETFAGDPTFLGLKMLLTIHNLGYQGHFGPEILPAIGLGGGLAALEHNGGINLLSGGIHYADAINTVSRRYSQEIRTAEYGHGLDSLLRERSAVVSGILNGVDYEEWDPVADPHIAANYSAGDLSGKRECKRDLLELYGLPAGEPERPLIGIVSRLVPQKGIDLTVEILEELLAGDVSMVLLGTGAPMFEDRLRALATLHPDKLGVRIGYDNALAHKIEAGSDMFLMPSHYEPCGLNQIYSLRYGTVPVVRATGGLDDTVDSTTGFKFTDYTAEALLDTIRAALEAYRDKNGWEAMMRRGMAK